MPNERTLVNRRQWAGAPQRPLLQASPTRPVDNSHVDAAAAILALGQRLGLIRMAIETELKRRKRA